MKWKAKPIVHALADVRIVCWVEHDDDKLKSWVVVSDDLRDTPEKDAKLIALAPELLDLAKELYDQLAEWGNLKMLQNMSDSDWDRYNQLRSCLENAIGEVDPKWLDVDN